MYMFNCPRGMEKLPWSPRNLLCIEIEFEFGVLVIVDEVNGDQRTWMKTVVRAGTRNNTKHYPGFETGPYRRGATFLPVIPILLEFTVRYKLIITQGSYWYSTRWFSRSLILSFPALMKKNNSNNQPNKQNKNKNKNKNKVIENED